VGALNHWPPTLADLKEDMKIKADDTRDDADLQLNLDAAVAHVVDVRNDLDFLRDEGDPRPKPTPAHFLGTLRLAARWSSRRRSPDGMIVAGELGSARVASYDPDIEQLLGVGRYMQSRFA
jgi:hypothetical protein